MLNNFSKNTLTLDEFYEKMPLPELVNYSKKEWILLRLVNDIVWILYNILEGNPQKSFRGGLRDDG